MKKLLLLLAVVMTMLSCSDAKRTVMLKYDFQLEVTGAQATQAQLDAVVALFKAKQLPVGASIAISKETTTEDGQEQLKELDSDVAGIVTSALGKVSLDELQKLVPAGSSVTYAATHAGTSSMVKAVIFRL
ncbi:MAG: hypothetical protein RR329_05190 [Mucinivorans sp.]